MLFEVREIGGLGKVREIGETGSRIRMGGI